MRETFFSVMHTCFNNFVIIWLLLLSMIQSKCLLPLGDSITQADSYHASWRYHLWKALVDAELTYTWTGSMLEHSGGHPPPNIHPDYQGLKFPNNHEGHSAWKIDDVLSNTENKGTHGSGNIHEWLAEYECIPTCTLIHLGTNDVCLGDSLETTRSELHELISLLRAATGTTIILAVPIPTRESGWNCCRNVSLLTPLILSLDNPGDRVFVVRQDVGMNASDLRDCYHPATSGEVKMAAVWLDAISEHCSDYTTTVPKTVTITNTSTKTTTKTPSSTTTTTATMTSTRSSTTNTTSTRTRTAIPATSSALTTTTPQIGFLVVDAASVITTGGAATTTSRGVTTPITEDVLSDSSSPTSSTSTTNSTSFDPSILEEENGALRSRAFVFTFCCMFAVRM